MLNINVFERAINQSRDGMVITERQGKSDVVVFANDAFCKITGYSRDQVIGKDCRFLQHGDSAQPQVKQIAEAVSQDQPVLVTLRNYRQDGTLFWNELSISPIDDQGDEVKYFLGIQRDVSDRVELERRMRLTNEELKGLNLALQKENEVDPVTAIYNRKVMDTRLMDFWNQAKRNSQPVALFFMDVDYFKKINDEHGHDIGDACLRQVAQRLQKYFQRATELLFRYGGEEFIAISVGASPAEVSSLAQSILEEFRNNPLEVVQLESGLPITMSIGLLHNRPEPDEQLEVMIRDGDALMYEAKSQGRDCIVSNLDFTEEMVLIPFPDA
jgi:diguanylate cyclase (GGDEF)-like protein/PAS domain S-box-containing protein